MKLFKIELKLNKTIAKTFRINGQAYALAAPYFLEKIGFEVRYLKSKPYLADLEGLRYKVCCGSGNIDCRPSYCKGIGRDKFNIYDVKEYLKKDFDKIIVVSLKNTEFMYARVINIDEIEDNGKYSWQ